MLKNVLIMRTSLLAALLTITCARAALAGSFVQAPACPGAPSICGGVFGQIIGVGGSTPVYELMHFGGGNILQIITYGGLPLGFFDAVPANVPGFQVPPTRGDELFPLSFSPSDMLTEFYGVDVFNATWNKRTFNLSTPVHLPAGDYFLGMLGAGLVSNGYTEFENGGHLDLGAGFTLNFDPYTPIPEPSTLLLAGSMITSWMVRRLRRSKRAARHRRPQYSDCDTPSDTPTTAH